MLAGRPERRTIISIYVRMFGELSGVRHAAVKDFETVCCEHAAVSTVMLVTCVW